MTSLLAGLCLIGTLWADPNASESTQMRIKRLRETALKARQEAAAAPKGSPQKLAAEKKAAEAIIGIEREGSKAGGDLAAQRAVGQTLVSLHEFGRATPYFTRAVELSRGTTDRHLLSEVLAERGRAYEAQGLYRAAFADAAEACKLEPASRPACGLAMLTRGRADAGEGSASAGGGGAGATAGSPSPEGGAAARESAAGSSAVPQTTYRHPDGVPPAGERPPEALEAAAFNAVRLGDPAKAAALAERLRSGFPKNAKALLSAARVLGALKRDQEALAAADAALARDPGLAAAHAERALIGRRLGWDRERMLADLQKAAELDPSFAEEYRKALDPAAASAGEKSAPHPGRDGARTGASGLFGGAWLAAAGTAPARAGLAAAAALALLAAALLRRRR